MTDAIPCREQIMVKLLAKLDAIPGAEAERGRRDPYTDDDLTAADRLNLLEDDGEDDFTIFVGENGYSLPIAVQAAVRGGLDAPTRNNLLRARVIAALMSDGHTVGGLARDVRLDNTGTWIGVATPEGAEGFTLGAVVIYATADGDPYTFA